MRLPNPLGIVGLAPWILAWPLLGQAFSQPINLSLNPGTSELPAVAFDGGFNVFVVWADDTSGNKEVLAKRSTDGGITFSSTFNVSVNTGTSESPAVALDGSNNIHVVWVDDSSGSRQILAKRSTDGGFTFSSAVNVSFATGTPSSPAVALDGSNNIHVVWADDGSGGKEILARRSTDGGLTFSSSVNVSNSTGTSESPALALDGNNLDVVWTDDTSGNKEILARRSTDGGFTFSSALNVSFTTGASESPAVAFDGNNVHVVWSDDTSGNKEILARHSTDGGLTFSSAINVSSNSGTSESPTVAFDGSFNVLVGWADDTLGNAELLARRSTDGGITFSSASNVSSNTGESLHPRLVLDGSGAGSFVWQDDTPGNFDILSRRVNLANLPPLADAGNDQTIECPGPTGTAVQLDGSGSSDPDGDSLSFEWKDGTGQVVGTAATVNLALQPGTHTFTLTVSDGFGGTAGDSVVVSVQDTTPPTLSFTLSPNVLWPPNHRLVLVTATIVSSDTCNTTPTVVLVSITSSEPDNGLGDGDTVSDIQGAAFGTDDRSFLLRAERAGAGSGRVYAVRYRSTDASGNTTFATGQVLVSHGKTK